VRIHVATGCYDMSHRLRVGQHAVFEAQIVASEKVLKDS
jgi:hypothetical protein